MKMRLSLVAALAAVVLFFGWQLAKGRPKACPVCGDVFIVTVEIYPTSRTYLECWRCDWRPAWYEIGARP